MVGRSYRFIHPRSSNSGGVSTSLRRGIDSFNLAAIRQHVSVSPLARPRSRPLLRAHRAQAAAGRSEVRLAKLRRLNMRLSFAAASMEFHFCLGLARFR
jgi:hypothetical protein